MALCAARGGRLTGPNVYPEAPDGGWGWLVAVAFFLVEVFTYGTIKSFGIFLQDLMEEFKETNSRVSWIISICVFVMTFTAPLSSVLTNRFGFRPVVMVGGVLITIGTISTGFTNSINEMYLTTGVVTGLGYCLTFLPTVTILSQYFNRRRSLVTALASTGESFCMFALAPAFSALKDRIGWRYTIIILGALQGSIIICGALLRPIIIKPRASPETETLTQSEGDALKTDKSEGTNFKSTDTKPSSCSPIVSCRLNSELPRGDSLNSGDSGVQSLREADAVSQEKALLHEKDRSTVLVEDDREDGEKSVDGEKKVSRDQEKGEKTDETNEDTDETVTVQSRKLLDFSILKEGSFIFYSLFGLFATLGFFAPPLYIIELSVSRGVDRDRAAYMLSVMAVAEVCGRFSIGWVLSRKLLMHRKPYALLGCIIAMTVVLVSFTLVQEFWGLAVCCSFYGFFMGAIACTHIPMLAEDEVVGIERMSSAAGVYVFIQSFAGLAGPPLGGVLVDITDNYGSAFYSCAVGTGVGAIFLSLVPRAKRGLLCFKADQQQNKATHKEQDNAVDQGGDRQKEESRDSPQEYLEVDVELSQSEESAKENNGQIDSSA